LSLRFSDVRVVLRRSASASVRPPPSPIVVEVERLERGVEAQSLCQRPPSALSQGIVAEVGRRERGVEAQRLCQRPPSDLSQGIAAEV